MTNDRIYSVDLSDGFSELELADMEKDNGVIKREIDIEALDEGVHFTATEIEFLTVDVSPFDNTD